MVDALGRFVEGSVRPVITTGFGAAIVYMAVFQQNHDAQVLLLNLAVLTIGFWFKDRTAEKAAEAAK